jgi:hypothetical protein
MEKEFTYFWDRFEEIFAKEWMSKEYTEDCALLCDFLTKSYPDNLSLPKIYAVQDSVILEWDINNNDISLDIKVNTLKGLWHSLNHETNEEEEFTIDLVDDINWIVIFYNLLQITGPSPCPPLAEKMIKDYNEAIEKGDILP